MLFAALIDNRNTTNDTNHTNHQAALQSQTALSDEQWAEITQVWLFYSIDRVSSSFRCPRSIVQPSIYIIIITKQVFHALDRDRTGALSNKVQTEAAAMASIDRLICIHTPPFAGTTRPCWHSIDAIKSTTATTD